MSNNGTTQVGQNPSADDGTVIKGFVDDAQSAITDSEIRMRARCWANLFGLDENQVHKILGRFHAEHRYTSKDIDFRYFDWEPDFEKAMALCRHAVFMKILENGRPEDISAWIALGYKLAGEDSVPGSWPGIEELCRWAAESYLLPD